MDAGVVAIIPYESDSVPAYGFNPHLFPAHERGEKEDFPLGKLPHLLVTAHARGARTGAAESVERVGAGVAIRPCDVEGLLAGVEHDLARRV